MEHTSRNRSRGSDRYAKPSELLQQIGLMGKEVVKILKRMGWEVCDPKALQEHKLYYAPGGRAKGEMAVHGEDFFVGEGGSMHTFSTKVAFASCYRMKIGRQNRR
nr:hypothetical protein PF009_g28080 [Phytophthora fragariae]